MILKFKTYQMSNEAWHIISEITNVCHARITKEQRQNPNLIVNDVVQALDDNGRINEQFQTYILVQAWHKRNSDPINIITNMPVYLLNDEGKTVERIN